MIMNFIGKTVNLVATTTPFDPNSILVQQQTPITKSLMVEPTLNIRSGLVLFIVDDAHLTTDLCVNDGGENKYTHSKGKGNDIAKYGLGTSKQCQTTQGKKKGLVTLNPKVSTDVAKLWNELTNGSGNFNSPTKVDVAFIVQNTKHNKESPTKGYGLVVQSTSRNASQVSKILKLKSPSLIFLNVFGYPW